MKPYVIRLEQVRIGRPTQYPGRGDDPPWVSSIDRVPWASAAIYVTPTGLSMDTCTDTRERKADFIGAHQMHGGHMRAVMAYAHSAHFTWWSDCIGYQAALGRTFGEQLRVAGCDGEPFDETVVRLGDVWQWGQTVRLAVTAPRIPCLTLERHFGLPMIEIMAQSGYRSGWYLKVLTPGFAPTRGLITVTPNQMGPTMADVFAGRMKLTPA